jgi:hypothetical protein
LNMNKEAEFLVKVAYLRGQADAQDDLYRKGYIKEAANWWPSLAEKLKSLVMKHPYAVGGIGGAGVGALGGALGGALEGLVEEPMQEEYNWHPAITNAALNAILGIPGGIVGMAGSAGGGALRGLGSKYIADKTDMSLPQASSALGAGVGGILGGVGGVGLGLGGATLLKSLLRK